MYNAQHGKPNRHKKTSSKNVNLGVSTYNMQFSDSNATKHKTTTVNTSSSNIKLAVKDLQSFSHVLGNRQRGDYHNQVTSVQFPDTPIASSIGVNKTKSANNSSYFSTTSANLSPQVYDMTNPISVPYDHQQILRTSHRNSSPQHHKSSGERVIFAESSSSPGIPIVYRLEEERRCNPDKLNLDRRKLCVCPILEGEENLRLLNFQHNNIRKVQHLVALKKLIFLDFYDNHIEKMDGLASLKSLRVLMLGKNRIQKIDNLHELVLLDVLDLHGNKITKVENVSQLRQLRVLNLAGNMLTVVKNLTGLTALSELNLRRNKIHTVLEIDQLPSLQRLFLSFNDIERFEDIVCVSKSTSLIELSLDGNPFSDETTYKQTVLQSIISLRQLDTKRISEEEKRIAIVMAKREEERRREADRLTSIQEKRMLAINNAQQQWNKQFNSLSTDEHPRSRESNDYYSSHLAELDGDSLNLYGPASLDAIDKDWGEKTASGMTSINFKFINFYQVVTVLKKLRSRFPSLTSLHFALTNISKFNDINAFAVLDKLDNLHISEEGNPIVKLSLWKQYAIFRLTSLNLKTLNGNQITEDEVSRSQRTFDTLTSATTKLFPWRLSTLFALQKEARNNDSNNQDSGMSSSLKQSIDKVGLFYRPVLQMNVMKSNQQEMFSKGYIREILQEAIRTECKQMYFEKLWPSMLKDMFEKYLSEICDTEMYCKQSLDKIKKSVNVT